MVHFFSTLRPIIPCSQHLPSFPLQALPLASTAAKIDMSLGGCFSFVLPTHFGRETHDCVLCFAIYPHFLLSLHTTHTRLKAHSALPPSFPPSFTYYSSSFCPPCPPPPLPPPPPSAHTFQSIQHTDGRTRHGPIQHLLILMPTLPSPSALPPPLPPPPPSPSPHTFQTHGQTHPAHPPPNKTRPDPAPAPR